jgi:hypothetical protein
MVVQDGRVVYRSDFNVAHSESVDAVLGVKGKDSVGVVLGIKGYIIKLEGGTQQKS